MFSLFNFSSIFPGGQLTRPFAGADAMGVPVYVLAYAGTTIYCSVTGAHGCEQLAQSRYAAALWPGIELATSSPQVRRPSVGNHATRHVHI